MKKILTIILFSFFQLNFFSQVVSTNIKDLTIKKILKNDSPKDKIISFEITLDQILIAEAARNTIDNNDCRSTWGSVRIKFFELDANGQIDLRKSIPSDLNEDTFFDKVIGRNAPFRSKSYYQDRIGVSNNEYIKRISVRVSENMVKNRRIVARVEVQLRTAHKDNDFASYDVLRMSTPTSTIFYLEDLPIKEETVSVITNGHSSIVRVVGGGEAEGINGGNSDDTHRIWLGFTIKKK